ncbi:MAG: pantoate--beta-alanine ligase [Elusimicrobiota bacterium]
MKILRTCREIQNISRRLASTGKTIGVIPTMGALHDGHAALITRARKENDVVIVTIFVNPAQFGPNEDYLRYPRMLKKDAALCRSIGVDYIFTPVPNEMYPEGYKTYVNIEKIDNLLCGKFRPGHFRGVATIVLKLFNLTNPTRAYFGLKDFQQIRVVKRMVQDLNLAVSIVECPIIREHDGLAKSSRNAYLSKEQRLKSLALSCALNTARKLVVNKKIRFAKTVLSAIRSIINKSNPSKIDYISICAPDTLEEVKNIKLPVVILLAVWYGNTRLIDNLYIK